MELVDNEVRLTMAVDFCELGIYEHYVPAGEKLYCNKWCRSILELPHGEPVSPDLFIQRLANRVHTDDWNHVRESYLDFLAGRSIRYEADARLQINSGTWKYISGFAKAIERDDAGTATHVVGVIKDITRYKQAELDRCKYTRQLQELSSQLGIAEERERHRIASGMHDTAIQDLALAQIKLGQLEQQFPDARLRPAVDEVRNLVDSAIRTTRTMVFELSPPVLYELGLEAALSWLCDTLDAKYGVRFDLKAESPDSPLPEDRKVILFQAIRELALNVCQHAGVQEATIQISTSDHHIAVVVEDRGRGFDMRGARNHSRENSEFGLFSIRERAKLLGGRVTIDSEPGRGTRVEFLLPLRQGPDSQP